MSASPTALAPAGRAARLVVLGGLIGSAFDIVYAILFYGAVYGVAPLRILQSVASGLLGRASYEGGAGSAALGLALHFAIAVAAACVFYAVSLRLPLLVRRPFVCGPLYGLAIYGFMNFVVLPLSAYPHKMSFPLLPLVTGLLVHAFLVGLPIALCVRAAAWPVAAAPPGQLER